MRSAILESEPRGTGVPCRLTESWDCGWCMTLGDRMVVPKERIVGEEGAPAPRLRHVGIEK